MFETPEEVRHITQLPIFVSSDALLPFETSETIHIDKPADRQLLADITFGERYFGVTNKYLTERKTGLPYIDGVGCIGKLIESNTFASGDSNIKLLGISRYRVKSFVETGKPYPVAEIIPFNDVEPDAEKAEELESLSRELCLILQRIMTKMIHSFGDPNFEAPLFEPEIIPFSFLMGQLFSFDLGWRLKLCRQIPSESASNTALGN